MRATILGSAAACMLANPALAGRPGMADEVYSATVENGEVEVEARYGRLTGGPDDGVDAMKLEAAYGVTDRLRVAVVGEFGREPGVHRKLTAASIEAIYALGKTGGINFATYVEYEKAFDGPDKIETKLLMQHVGGPWDLRLNLVASKPLESGAKVELGYAASADVAVAPRVRLGAQAYGDLGTFSQFAPAAEHYLGPVAKLHLLKYDPDHDGDDHGGLSLTAGYLFALGRTRDSTNGQVHINLEMDF